GIVRQAGCFSFNTDGVGVAVCGRGHPTSMVGDTGCDEVHGAVAGEEQLRQGTTEAGPTVSNNVQGRAVAALRSSRMVRDDGANRSHRSVTTRSPPGHLLILHASVLYSPFEPCSECVCH